MLTGGCACGTIRYRIAGDVYDSGWCHCRLCQKTSGAPAVMFATTRLEGFAIEQGPEALGIARLTAYGERGFCTRCGSLLTIHVGYQPEEIDIAAGTLDDPGAVTPGFHIFWEERMPWFPADDLPKHQGFGVDARGLEPGARPA